MAHTQEPWKFLEQGDADEYCIVTEDGLKWVIAFRINGEMMPDMQRANARRIVACVNACAEISTETLESAGKFPLTKSSLNGYLHMKAQRNELLEALRDFVSDHENISDGTLNFGRAVIASVEAE